MYVGIDIGGTKTLVATLDDGGVIEQRYKFPTSATYNEFKKTLADTVEKIATKELIACGIGAPGRVDRTNGGIIALGNLPWKDVPIQKDVQKLLNCPVVVDNDANLAALSEAMVLKGRYRRVLYITVGTGIGTGFIVDQTIEPNFADAEGGKMLMEHQGKMAEWEAFASGRAIKQQYGKQAKDITDHNTWKAIAHNIALGVVELIAIVQPEVIVFGGGVSTYYERFADLLREELHSYETPLVLIPEIRQAARPEDAVIYGCYDLARSTYGKSAA